MNYNTQEQIQYLINYLSTKTINNKKIFVYGDSHTRTVVRASLSINGLNIYNIGRSSVSMTGLTRENSRLNYRATVVDYLTKHNSPNDYHILKFGQVDAEYIYYYKTVILKQTISADNFFRKIILDYVNFIKGFGNRNIIVCGSNMCTPIPNWKDLIIGFIAKTEEEKGEAYRDLHNLTYENHNRHILLFNSILKEECEKNNIVYFDTTEECFDFEKFTLKEKYLGRCNHYRGGESDLRGVIDQNGDNLYGVETYITFLEKILQTL